MDIGHARVFVALISLFATGYTCVGMVFMGDCAPFESHTYAVSRFYHDWFPIVALLVGVLSLGSVALWGYKRPSGWLSLWDLLLAAVPLTLLVTLWACVSLPNLFSGSP